jgi:hypothetical protein
MNGLRFMSNKNGICKVFLLVLIGFCFYSCNGQEPTYEQQSSCTKSNGVTGSRNQPKVAGMDFEMASMCNEIDLFKNVHKFVADAKYAGVLDEDLIRVLIAYSILNNVPIEEVKKFLTAAKFAGLSDKVRSVGITGNTADSSKPSSLSSGANVMIILACLVIVGAGSTYIFKEYYNFREKEERKKALRDAFYQMGEDFERAGDRAKQGFSNAWKRVSTWWNS